MIGLAAKAVEPEVEEHVIQDSDVGAKQFVAFTIDEQIYCVDIMSVREIRAWSGTTSLPNTAEYVLGVINLRGIIVPIVDLRNRFGQGATEPTSSHVVIIAMIKGKLNGLLVDTVSDILTAHKSDIAPNPETTGGSDNSYLRGLITKDETMIAVIELDTLLGVDVERD